MLIRGPEGEQKHWDAKGKLSRGKERTEFVDYHKHMNDLLVEAGIVDPLIQKIEEELKRADAFWGGTPTLPTPQKAP